MMKTTYFRKQYFVFREGRALGRFRPTALFHFWQMSVLQIHAATEHCIAEGTKGLHP